MLIIMQGIYIWSPWRQDISVTLPIVLPQSNPPAHIDTPYGSVETDYTRIINPAEIETRITKDEYSKIEMGMSYKDIVDIVGGTGMLLNKTNA
jgi:hypothetical protein